MELDERTLRELLNETLHDSDIRPDEIPAIDLYMDQIITLFESRLGDNRRYPDDKLLTKTMINNYSKEGLLKAIKGKTYSREHIIEILLIYCLKQTLSIHDVKAVLLQSHESPDLAEIYSRHLRLKEQMREQLPGSLLDLFQGDTFSGLCEEDRKLLAVLVLSSMGNYMKRLSETIIDHCL